MILVTNCYFQHPVCVVNVKAIIDAPYNLVNTNYWTKDCRKIQTSRYIVYYKH